MKKIEVKGIGQSQQSIGETIQTLIDAYREQWDEPNCVRMGVSAYRQLQNELAIAEGREPLSSDDTFQATIGQIHGYKITLNLGDGFDEDICVEHTDYPGYIVRQSVRRFGDTNA